MVCLVDIKASLTRCVLVAWRGAEGQLDELLSLLGPYRGDTWLDTP